MSIFTEFYKHLQEAPTLSPRVEPKSVQNKKRGINPQTGELTPGEEARRLGLTSKGFGWWQNHTGLVTHRTVGDRLVKLTPKQQHLVNKQTLPPKPQQPLQKIPRNLPPLRSIGKNEESEPEKGKPYTFSSLSRRDAIKRLESIRSARIHDRKVKGRQFKLIDLWSDFINADSYTNQVDIVKELAKNNFIERRAGNKHKIYLSANVGIANPKYLCGAKGNAITTAMNSIITKFGIAVPTRASVKFAELRAIRGDCHELGLTTMLDPFKKTKKEYKKSLAAYALLSGNYKNLEKAVSNASKLIRQSLPSGSHILGAVRVGDISPPQLKNTYGILRGEDPTDIIVLYKYKDKVKELKISAKLHDNFNNFVIHAAGVVNVGKKFFGEPMGSDLDNKYKDLKKKYDWNNPGLSEEEVMNRKRRIKELYMIQFNKVLEKLQQSKSGQQILHGLWNRLHACGKNVTTLITSTATLESKLIPPNSFCQTNKKIEVVYSETSITISIKGSPHNSLLLNLETRSDGDNKLQFRHITSGADL